MIARVRRIWTRWRFSRAFAAYDRQIAAARAQHAPVKHLRQAKTDAIHAALRGGRHG